ncbi:MAG: AAA family ATPase [Phycisphaerae bacterium]|nr:AAA family ATPase [Phycisphaerae bacterium]
MILRQIIDWANNELDPWKRQAVRMLLTQDSIDDSDENNLFLMLKESYSLPCDAKSNLSDKPLKAEEISGSNEKGHVIVLRQINEIKGVNAIPAESCISFAHSGMTVIYGENGSGKSGYSRIFKKACFARDDKEEIHGNVFLSTPQVIPEAVFKLDIDGIETHIKWVDRKEKPEVLGNICVFDSKSARVIIDERNSVSYLPYGADVFQKIVALTHKFKDKLEQEKPKTSKPEISDMPETTKAGAAFSSLNSKTKIEDLQYWSQWKEGYGENSDEHKLIELNTKYNLAMTGDTTKQVRTLVNVKSRLMSFKEQMSKISGLFSLESLNHFNELLESRKNFKKAFEKVSQKPEGPLSGITTTEWEVLYWAAKDYSVKQAYPDKTFPVTEVGQKCVLCMQDLSQEASLRLSNFYQYMESTVRQDLDSISDQINNIVKNLESFDFVKIKLDFNDVIDEMSNREKDISQEIIDYLNKSSELRESYLNAEKKCITCEAEAISLNIEQFEVVNKLISSEIEEFEKNSNPEEIKKLGTELIELKARKQFATNFDKIKQYLFDLKMIALYDLVISYLETRSITQKGKTLIGQALTPQLKEALTEELKSLGISHFSFDLKHSGSAGENTHQMKIQTRDGTSGIKLTEILSEGEQRVIAVAGFLAELSLQGKPMPIVFDDPVSSLDHEYSEKIAARLVDVSKNRQVVIFTHDISFMLELQRKSEENGLHCHCVSVHREGNAAGKIRGETAWHAMKVGQRLQFIEENLHKIVHLFPDKRLKYNSEVAVLYGYLRETWEAAVEEILFNNTIRRFSAEVQTLRLREVEINDTDHVMISKGMATCSKWMIGHDLSKLISENRPSPADLQISIQELRDFVAGLKTRRKATVAMKTIVTPKIG